MKSAREILPAVCKSGASQPFSGEQLVRAFWDSAVGKKVADHCRPLRMDGRRLLVAVDDEVWQRQMTALSGQVAARLNRLMGDKVVGKIRWQVRLPERKPVSVAARAMEPSDEAAEIADPHLRLLYLRSKREAAGR